MTIHTEILQEKTFFDLFASSSLLLVVWFVCCIYSSVGIRDTLGSWLFVSLMYLGRGVGVTDLGLSPNKPKTSSSPLPYSMIFNTNCSGPELGNSRSLGDYKTKQRMDEHCKHNTNT